MECDLQQTTDQSSLLKELQVVFSDGTTSTVAVDAETYEQIVIKKDANAIAALSKTFNQISSCNTDGEIDKSKLSKIYGGISWTEPAVLLLIKTWKDLKKLFISTKTKKVPLWQHVASVLRTAGYHVTWRQAKSKWRWLTKNYREAITDQKHITDSDCCPYFNELSDAYGMSKSISPTITGSSLSDSNQTKTHSNADIIDNEGEEKETSLMLTNTYKKRKTLSRARSDATEPFATVRRFQKDFENIERERIILMQEIHKDRMEMLNKLMNI